MEDTAGKVRAWTDADITSLLLQLACRVGKIPWDELELPEGRTIRGCQQQFTKLKQSLPKEASKDAVEKASSGTKDTKTVKPKGTKKRNAEADDAEGHEDGDATPAKTKKAKQSTKGKKSKAEVKAEIEEAEENEVEGDE